MSIRITVGVSDLLLKVSCAVYNSRFLRVELRVPVMIGVKLRKNKRLSKIDLKCNSSDNTGYMVDGMC